MKKIIHVDMDCFYAAVEMKKNPSLRGKPLGIGGPANSRSVLCTANYEARKFGIKAAMPSSHAVRLCPKIILIPPDFLSYKMESKNVRQILERFTDKIEPLSLDEAYLDVSDCKEFNGSATLIAYEIRRLIYSELQLTASAGIAPNKFLAKIASDWNKPNGQYVINPHEISSFIESLPVKKIYGVGKVTAEKMEKLGLITCADIQKKSLPELASWFGGRAQELYDFSRGVDHREVESFSERKSISVEQTFDKDLTTFDDCKKHVPELYADWLGRYQKGSYQERLKSYAVKLKFFDFKATTHEASIKNIRSELPSESDFEALLYQAWQRREAAVRLIGLGVNLREQNPSPAKRHPGQLQFEFAI